MSERRPPDAEDLLAEAALWRERLAEGGDRRVREGFDRWLADSPAHAAAFADTEETLQAVKWTGEEPAILDLRQQTLTRLALRNRRWNWRPAIAAGLGCLLLGSAIVLGGRFLDALGIGASSATPESAATHYATGPGEVTSIELADGSRVTLNTSSRLRVAYSGAQRRLGLERGQAFFAVAKDAARPFVVEAAGRQVVAHGTAFDVRIEKRDLRVALLEGAVSVRRRTAPAIEAVWLRPDDVLKVEGGLVSVARHGNVQALAAWREGLLIFRDQELRSAVEEMNRYGATRIVIADERIAALRISGAFRIGQATSFVDALEATFPVKVADRTDGRIVLEGR